MSDIDPTNPDAVERFLGDAVVCTAGLPMAMAGVIRALQHQVRTLEGRTEDAKASADHRALVIGDLTSKLEVEKTRRLAAEKVADIASTMRVIHDRGRLEIDGNREFWEKLGAAIDEWEPWPSGVDDRPANVMSPDGKSVLGVALPAEYEDRRSATACPECHRVTESSCGNITCRFHVKHHAPGCSLGGQ